MTFFEWVKVRTQEVCEGNRIVQEIKIFKDWSFTVFVNNRKISKETLGNPELASSRKMTKYLFDVVTNFKMCKGFEVPCKKTAKDIKGNVTATTEEWCSKGEENVELRLRSVDCRVLVNDYNRSSIILCDYCTTCFLSPSDWRSRECTKEERKLYVWGRIKRETAPGANP